MYVQCTVCDVHIYYVHTYIHTLFFPTAKHEVASAVSDCCTVDGLTVDHKPNTVTIRRRVRTSYMQAGDGWILRLLRRSGHGYSNCLQVT